MISVNEAYPLNKPVSENTTSPVKVKLLNDKVSTNSNSAGAGDLMELRKKDASALKVYTKASRSVLSLALINPELEVVALLYVFSVPHIAVPSADHFSI